MSQDVKLEAVAREALGKRAVAALRAEGKVPAVIQEHGKESINILVGGPEILKAFAAVGKSQAIDLTVGGTKNLHLLKKLNLFH